MANNSLEQKIIEHLGYKPNNEEDFFKLFIGNAVALGDVRLVLNPSEEFQLRIVREHPSIIKYFRVPTLKVQLEAIRLSKYNLNIIMYCPDYKEFEEEIMNNLMIKDIIE
jgi:hypothetical protein